MSTVQIVAIAVAAVVVVLLVVALLVTRRRASSTQGEGLEAPESASFLDQNPQDTLSGLGEAEQPREEEANPSEPRVGDATMPVELGEEAGADLGAVGSEGDSDEAPAVGEAETPEEADLSGIPPTEPSGDGPIPEDLGETTGEPLGVVVEPAGEEIEPLTEVDEEGVGATPAGFIEPDEEPAADGDRPDGMVALSEIIVTTSTKLVDLRDPDVRRMLTDLVKLEVDQAVEYRRQGQTVDAVLQLVEAEKISRALGLNESAERVHKMIEELNRLA